MTQKVVIIGVPKGKFNLLREYLQNVFYDVSTKGKNLIVKISNINFEPEYDTKDSDFLEHLQNNLGNNFGMAVMGNYLEEFYTVGNPSKFGIKLNRSIDY